MLCKTNNWCNSTSACRIGLGLHARKAFLHQNVQNYDCNIISLLICRKFRMRHFIFSLKRLREL